MRSGDRVMLVDTRLSVDETVELWERNAPHEGPLLAEVLITTRGRLSVGRPFVRRTRVTSVLRAGAVSEAQLVRAIDFAIATFVERSHRETVGRLKVGR